MAAAELERSEVPGIRPFWSGTVTFGLVSIPVALFAATRARSVSLRMVAPDGTPVERRYVCPEDGKELDRDEIVRGWELPDGKFVVVTDEELEAIEPRKTREIDLHLFVPRDQIDPALFERAYFLAPASGSNKAYRLLAAVMEKTGRAGIATFVMRSKEYIVAILAEHGILHAETLRFADEIRSPEDVGLPKKAKPEPARVRAFEREIRKRTKKVDFSEFLDDWAERVAAVAEKKAKKGEDVVRVAEPPAAREEAEVVDLLEVLSRSLRGPGGSRQGAGRRRPKAPRAAKGAR